nr:unnamed protein product [Callosobruchus analis]CAI5867109.1 unnamed protein product [Callosobruchus analis]
MDFEEELINEVRCNDLLWDKRSEYYKNRAKTDRAWEAVANKLKKPSKSLMEFHVFITCIINIVEFIKLLRYIYAFLLAK